MELTKMCPLLIKKTVVHNTIQNSRVSHIGINKYRDNDVIVSRFLPCIGDACMMFDTDTQTCRYFKNDF